MDGKRLTKFISGAVVVSVILTTGITTLAAQKNRSFGTALKNGNNAVATSKTNDGKGHCKVSDKGRNFNSLLAEMVKDGTLTQSEMDKITAFKKEKQESMRAEMDKVKNMTAEERKNYLSTKKTEHQDVLTELVDKGIITQTKADLIKAKIEKKYQEMKSARLNEMKSQIGTLVKKGIINQNQADKVIEYMNQMEEKIKIQKDNVTQTEKDKIKNMTEKERKAYFEKVRGEKGNFLKELVDNETLTQEQANAVRESIRPHHGKGVKGK